MMFWMLAQITNHEKIGRGLDCLRRGLLPLIDSRLRPEDKANWQIRPVRGTTWNSTALDVKDCLEILNKFWDDRFRSPKLGRGERAWVNELIDKVRNQNAHRTSADDVPDDDTWRALDTAERLLAAIGSSEAENVRALRLSLRDKLSAPVQYEASQRLPRPPDNGSARAGPQKSGHPSIFESLYLPDLLGELPSSAPREGCGRYVSALVRISRGRWSQMPNTSYESISTEGGQPSTSRGT